MPHRRPATQEICRPRAELSCTRACQHKPLWHLMRLDKVVNGIEQPWDFLDLVHDNCRHAGIKHQNLSRKRIGVGKKKVFYWPFEKVEYDARPRIQSLAQK